MSYVPGYAHDIFVSYAQVDDLTDREGEDGWVTALIKKLKNRLAQLLGRQDNFSLWYDHHLRHNVYLTPEIMGTIERTATLVVILSPGYLESEWCTRERDTFLKLVEERRANEGASFSSSETRSSWRGVPGNLATCWVTTSGRKIAREGRRESWECHVQATMKALTLTS